MKNIVDSHIHLGQYAEDEIEKIIGDLDDIQCTGLISVSSHLHSCRTNLALSKKYKQVNPAFGFHPEQALPSDLEIETLLSWIEKIKKKWLRLVK